MTAVGLQRDIPVMAADGTTRLLDHYQPARRGDASLAGSDVVVRIRTPYGRKGIASIAKWFAKTGAHVIIEAVRGTDGSGGEFDPFDVTPDDAGAVLDWMRRQS